MVVVASIADIGHAIRAARKAKGLTQTDLADFCGVSLSFISNLERGKETTEAGKMLKVIQTLGLELFIEKRG